MTPKAFVTLIAVLFVGGVLVSIASGGQLLASLSSTSWLTALVFAGLAVRLGAGLVKGCRVDRWVTVLAAAALAAGIYLNSGERPTAAFVVLGFVFCVCVIGLLTPFAGRHFAEMPPAGADEAD